MSTFWCPHTPPPHLFVFTCPIDCNNKCVVAASVVVHLFVDVSRGQFSFVLHGRYPGRGAPTPSKDEKVRDETPATRTGREIRPTSAGVPKRPRGATHFLIIIGMLTTYRLNGAIEIEAKRMWIDESFCCSGSAVLV